MELDEFDDDIVDDVDTRNDYGLESENLETYQDCESDETSNQIAVSTV